MGYIIYLLNKSHHLLKTSQCFYLFILGVEFCGYILVWNLVSNWSQLSLKIWYPCDAHWSLVFIISGKLKLCKWVFSTFRKANTIKPTLVSQGAFRGGTQKRSCEEDWLSQWCDFIVHPTVNRVALCSLTTSMMELTHLFFWLKRNIFTTEMEPSCPAAWLKRKPSWLKPKQHNETKQHAAASSGTSLQGRQMDTFIFPDLFANVKIPVQALALQIII